MSLADHTIESYVKQRKKNAQVLKEIKGKTEKLLITILIGNNLINTLTASLATMISIWIAEKAWWTIKESYIVWWVSLLITILILLFGEVLPKTFASRYAWPISLVISPFYKFLMFLFTPIVACVYAVTVAVSPKDDDVARRISDEEVEAMIEMSQKQWAIDKDEYTKIKQVLDLDTTTVEEIMTPRIRIEAFDREMTVKEAMDKIMDYSHTRIPVYEGTLDSIVSVVNLKELYTYSTQWKENEKLSSFDLEDVIKVPLTQPINKLLWTFQREHKLLSVVIDEYGGVAWLVTLEDIVEEVFGEIRDETDEELEQIEFDGKTRHVDSYVLVEDVIERLELEVDENYIKDLGGETLSYLVTDHLGRFPNQWESMTVWLRTDDHEEDEDYPTPKIRITVNNVDTNGVMGHIDIEIVAKEEKSEDETDSWNE